MTNIIMTIQGYLIMHVVVTYWFHKKKWYRPIFLAPPTAPLRRRRQIVRRQFLKVGAPRPTNCRLAAYSTLLSLIVLLHLSCVASYRYKCLPWCEIEVGLYMLQ